MSRYQPHNFRAAPLSPTEQSRRAGQLIRYLSLVPVEYERGVADGKISRDLEIQEAITFHASAYAAFSDLENLLDARDPAKAQQAKALFDSLGAQLAEAGKQASVAGPDQIQAQTTALTALLGGIMPAEWSKNSTQGDFDVITSMLNQMEAAVHSGDYALAASTRLEGYVVMESGPEARLMIFAPQLKLRLEELFWNGQGKEKGLAYLIKNEASIQEIQTTRTALNATLTESQTTLGQNNAPAAIATNAGLIVYREGFETVLFLQALVLEGGTTMVLIGIAAAMVAVGLVGVVTFKLQVNLPYRNMLIVTGVLIAGVLLQMVGNTVHVMQVLGWLPIHLIESISLPYWLGTWFGVYTTWEGVVLQIVATSYVIGSYYLAEWMQQRSRIQKAAQSIPQTAH